MDKSKYNETKVENEDGTIVITLTPKASEHWEPVKGDEYYYVNGEGRWEWSLWQGDKFDNKRLAHGNVFPTVGMAEKAAKLQAVNNNIIRACLLVDPDFESDWRSVDSPKWGVCCEYREWITACWYTMNVSPAYVSTEEKAKQVCALLTEWGIKP